MKLKLLIYAHSWAPAIGGVEIVTKMLAEEFARWHETHGGDRISVRLATLTSAGNYDDSSLPFEVIRRPSLGRLIHLFSSADIIHLAGPAVLPMALTWLLRKPTVLEHHNYQSVCPNGLLIFQPDRRICPGYFMSRRYAKCVKCNSSALGRTKSLRDLILMFPRRWLAKRVTTNVTPSHHMQRRAALPRTRVISHGVTRPGTPLIPHPTARNHSACFAFVGRLVEEKGVSVLLKAAHQLSQKGFDFRLTIVGDGPERQALETLSAELGLTHRTQFRGAVPVTSIPAVLGEVAAVVMPSTWEDVAPLVALEQMMQGRLLIVSDIGGLSETVDGFGLKFAAGDAAGLASQMQQVIENPNLSAEMGTKAQRHASVAYALERMVKDHLSLYDELKRRPQSRIVD